MPGKWMAAYRDRLRRPHKEHEPSAASGALRRSHRLENMGARSVRPDRHHLRGEVATYWAVRLGVGLLAALQ